MSMVEWVHVSIPIPNISPRALLAAHGETLLLAALLVVAFVARLVGLDRLEPNVMPDEADHLQVLYHLLVGTGPGPFDLSWDGNPAASLYPAYFFLKLLGPSYVALRLSTVFASMLVLIVFFLLARRTLNFFASYGATALLAFSYWSLFFSRSGEVNIWIVLYSLLAALFTERALKSNRWVNWIAAGLCCGLGWYGYLAGVLILPTMLLYVALDTLLWRRPTTRGLGSRFQVQGDPPGTSDLELGTWNVVRHRLLGATILALVSVALVLPRLPVILERRAAVEGYAGARSVLQDTRPTEVPAVLAGQLALTVRAFVLLDYSLQGNSRYIPPGDPVLDSFTGTLYFVGLCLGLRRFRQTLLWWCLFGVFILASQTLLRGIPDGARALPGLPAMVLFAGLTINWLIQRACLGELARLVLTVALPLTAYWNWNHYVDWQRQPSNAALRQPAVEVAEFATWQELQIVEARAKRRGFNVTEWKAMRDRYLPAPGPEAAAAESGPVAGRLEARPLAEFGPVEGLRKPRGVAADAAGLAYVLDSDGRVLKLGPNGRTVATLGVSTGGPRAEEASDLDIGPDGSLFLLDAARGQIDRYGPDGRFAATLSADWGMYRPRGLAVGKDGKIYVADTGRNRVVISRGGDVEQSLPDFEQPTDVAVDPSGRIYVAQPEASKLSVLEPEGRPIATWDISRSNTVEGPHLAYLEAGAVAITDPPKHSVRLLDLNGRELAQVGGENDATLGLPYAAAASGTRLYVADAAKPGVRAFEVIAR